MSTNNTNATTWLYDPTCASHYSTDPHSRLSSAIFILSSVTFVVVGLIGNALSVAVFSSPSSRKISSNVYLLALAASDALYLVCVFVSKIVPSLTCWEVISRLFDLYNRQEFACVALQYLDDLFADFSTCMILAFTVERYLAVYLPTRLKQICTVLRARGICAVVLATVAILICPHHVLYIRLHRDPHVCTILESDEVKFSTMYAVESLLLRIVPVGVIATLNIFIIARVRVIATNKNRLRSYNAPQTSVRPQTNVHVELTSCCTPRPSHQSKKSHGSLQLTITLILVSTTYIFLHIPVLVHFMLMQLFRFRLINLSRRTIFISLDYCRLLYVAAFAINFFLYTVSGSLFREQLVRMFARRGPNTRTRHSQGGVTNSTRNELRLARDHAGHFVCANACIEASKIATF